MNNSLKVLVIKDEDGVLRPQAGIWIDNIAGQNNAEYFLSKSRNHGALIVRGELKEIE